MGLSDVTLKVLVTFIDAPPASAVVFKGIRTWDIRNGFLRISGEPNKVASLINLNSIKLIDIAVESKGEGENNV